jgi:hypothetical protein
MLAAPNHDGPTVSGYNTFSDYKHIQPSTVLRKIIALF